MAELKTFVKNVVREILRTEYPMLEKTQCVTAKIKAARKSSETYYYTVRLLDNMGNENLLTAELPDIASDHAYKVGDGVVIQYVHGMQPYIIGRWLG